MGWDYVSMELRPLKGTMSSPADTSVSTEQRWKGIERIKPRVTGKTCPSDTLSTHHRPQTDLLSQRTQASALEVGDKPPGWWHGPFIIHIGRVVTSQKFYYTVNIPSK